MMKIIKGYNRFLSFMDGLASISIVVIMILITADVCSRLFLNKPFTGTAEIVSMMIIVVCFLEIPYVAVRGGHVRSTMLYDKVGDRGKHIIDAIASALGVVIYALIIYASWPGFTNAIAINEAELAGTFRVPTTPGRFVLIFGAALMSLEFVCLTIQHIVALVKGEAADVNKDTGVQEI